MRQSSESEQADQQKVISPAEVLKWLYPRAKDRRIAVEFLAEAVRVAHAQRETSWSLTLAEKYIRLNAGRAEVLALYPDELRFIVDRTRVPTRFGLDDYGQGLKSIPGSAAIDLSPAEASKEIQELRDGWYTAIRAAAMSASTCPYAKHHSPALLAYLREQLGAGTSIPDPHV